MKTASIKSGTALPVPVFPKTLHRLRASPKTVDKNSKPKKRDNIFSKSRDTREDRGIREMKTSHNEQTEARQR